MRSIRTWGRPFIFVAAFALLGLGQLGCSDECEQACAIEFQECLDGPEDPDPQCPENFKLCELGCNLEV